MAQLDLIINAVDKSRSGLGSLDTNLSKSERRTQALGRAAKVTALAVGGIAIAGIGIGAKLLNDFIHAGAELDKLSKLSNASAEQLQILGEIAQRSGGSAEDVADAYRELQLRLAEVAELGSGPAADALKIVGLTLEDLQGLNADETFERIRKAIAAVEDPALRLFAAEELLGGSSERLQALVGITAEEFARLTKEAREAGHIMSQEDVAAAAELEQHIRLLKNQVRGLALEGFRHLAPILTAAGELFATNEHITVRLRRAYEILQPTIRRTAGLMLLIGRHFGITSGTIRLLMDGVRTLRRVWDATWAHIRRAAEQATAAVQASIRRITSAVQSATSVVGGLGGLFSGPVNTIRDVIGNIPGFAAGGVVPGPRGAPVLAVVHGGERVIPNGGGGGGMTHITIELDGDSIYEGVVRAVTTANRRGDLG